MIYQRKDYFKLIINNVLLYNKMCMCVYYLIFQYLVLQTYSVTLVGRGKN